MRQIVIATKRGVMGWPALTVYRPMEAQDRWLVSEGDPGALSPARPAGHAEIGENLAYALVYAADFDVRVEYVEATT